MAHFLDDVIAEIGVACSNVHNRLNSLDSSLYWAAAYLKTGDYATAGAYLETASFNVYYFKLDLVSDSDSLGKRIKYAFSLIKWNWPDGAAEVDMDAILTAMFAAEPHQIMLWEAYTQAYKASVWNAPFDEQYFAALVRKWRLWE